MAVAERISSTSLRTSEATQALDDSIGRHSEVEAHLERVRGDELYLDAYRCMPTGGTTGRKGIFVYGRDEWRRCLAAFLRWSELTGVRPRLGRRIGVPGGARNDG